MSATIVVLFALTALGRMRTGNRCKPGRIGSISSTPTRSSVSSVVTRHVVVAVVISVTLLAALGAWSTKQAGRPVQRLAESDRVFLRDLRLRPTDLGLRTWPASP